MNKLDPVLPFLRPRSAEPTWYVLLLAGLLVLGLLALVGVYVVRWVRRRRRVKETFLRIAAERRLGPVHAAFLLDVAARRRLANPALLLTSAHAFERHVGELATRLADATPEDPALGTIAEIRSRLGFDELPADQALRSTRQLSSGQTLMAWITAAEAETGEPAEESAEDDAAPWLVVERDERGLTVAPLLKEEYRLFDDLRAGVLIGARFWRENDTEYRFVTDVVAVDLERHTAQLRHADRIERLQLRDFFRLPVDFPISLLIVADEEGGPEPLPEEAAAEPEALVARPLATTGGPGGTGAPATPPEGALRVGGRVRNLSAGGLYLLAPEAPPADALLCVDPQFAGDFPLAGLTCRVIHEAETPEGWALQLHYVDLPPGREGDLVRLIFQRQIEDRRQRLEAGGPAPPAPPDDPEGPATDGSISS